MLSKNWVGEAKEPAQCWAFNKGSSERPEDTLVQDSQKIGVEAEVNLPGQGGPWSYWIGTWGLQRELSLTHLK